MNQSLVVRPVEPSDHLAWLALWRAYNAFYGRQGDNALSPDITQATWARFFDPTEPMHARVAEQDGRLLGLTHFLYHRSTTQWGLSCYLQDLFTVEAARGNGVGRALIEAVYLHAKASDSPRVYWQTHETNATAMKLYDQIAERSGFVVYRKLI